MRNTTLINNVSYAFWQRQSRNEMIRIGLKILIFIGAMVLGRTANAQITVDGNPSDWPAVFSDPTIPFKTKIVDAVIQTTMYLQAVALKTTGQFQVGNG
jgi:hypothetical protein